MTLEECAANIGKPVIYRAPHLKPEAKGEAGILTSVTELHAFVRYGTDGYAKATSPALLTLAVES